MFLIHFVIRPFIKMTKKIPFVVNIKQIMKFQPYNYMTTNLQMKMKDSHTKSVFRQLPTKKNNFSAQFVIIHSVLKVI